jgi:hypothetical protein
MWANPGNCDMMKAKIDEYSGNMTDNSPVVKIK